MKDRIDAYEAIGKEDPEHQKTLLPIISWMRSILESFPKTEKGYIFFSGRRSVFTGHLESCAKTEYLSILKQCRECDNVDKQIIIIKAAIDQDYYQTAFLNLDGGINHICISDYEHPNGYDPERKLNTYPLQIPCPFQKGDTVCFVFDLETPLIFLEQDDQMRFKYISEDFITEPLSSKSSGMCDQLIFYKSELPYNKLQIAQQALRKSSI